MWHAWDPSGGEVALGPYCSSSTCVSSSANWVFSLASSHPLSVTNVSWNSRISSTARLGPRMFLLISSWNRQIRLGWGALTFTCLILLLVGGFPSNPIQRSSLQDSWLPPPSVQTLQGHHICFPQTRGGACSRVSMVEALDGTELGIVCICPAQCISHWPQPWFSGNVLKFSAVTYWFEGLSSTLGAPWSLGRTGTWPLGPSLRFGIL